MWWRKYSQISGSIVYTFIQYFFMACLVKDYQIILKLSFRPLAFTSCEETKRGLELVSILHFLDDF